MWGVVMLDKYDEFFLGQNVNEPVAIEIPIETEHIFELRDFLDDLGFITSTNGDETDKILIDIKENKALTAQTYSIITPALAPDKRKDFYDVLKKAIQIYKDFSKDKSLKILYPHILDLQNLVLSSYDRNTGLQDQVTDLLKTLEDSPEVKILYPGTESYEKDLVKIFSYDSLISGSSMPEPFTVATSYTNRFVRYATTDLSYGVSFSGVFGKKQYVGFQNISPDTTKIIGFVHQYKIRDDGQLYFGNSGVETNGSGILYNRAEYNETVVNRFDNPCVAQYMIWCDVKNPRKIFMYKMSEGDKRFELIRKYYKTYNTGLSYTKNKRFETWNSEGVNHQTYIPVKDGNVAKIQSKIEHMIQERDLQKQNIEDIEKNIDLMCSEIDGYTYFDINIMSVEQNIKFLEYYKIKDDLDKNLQIVHDYINKLNAIVGKVNDIQSEITSKNYLKEHNFVRLSTLVSLIQNKQTILQDKEQQLKTNLENLIKIFDENIKDCIRGSKKISSMDLSLLNGEMRRNILLKFKENISSIKEESAICSIIDIYEFSSSEDKAQLFDIMYDISKTAPRETRKLLKKYASMSHNEEVKEVLTELFSGDNIFVKHTEKARKLMALRMATINLKKQMANQNTGAVIENTSRDM